VGTVPQERQANHAIEDVEHPGAQIDRLVHIAQAAKLLQDRPDLARRNRRLPRVRSMGVGQTQVWVGQIIDAVDAETKRIVDRP
jgi:hypothetical protein